MYTIFWGVNEICLVSWKKSLGNKIEIVYKKAPEIYINLFQSSAEEDKIFKQKVILIQIISI